MAANRVPRSLCCLLVLVLGFGSLSRITAHEPFAERFPNEPFLAELFPEELFTEEADSSRQWLPRISRLRSPSVHERSHSQVLAAFRDVVNQPGKSTVRVLSAGKPAALGAIVDPDGYILTKASESKGELQCVLADGRRFDAQIVGVEPQFDLAMLRVNARNLPAIQWSDEDTPPVGSWLATPGPEKLPAAIGVVSVSPRRIAAPSGVLGVVLEQSDQGPRIEQVLPGSGAAKAGLRELDVITRVDGALVRTRQALVETIRRYQPGDQVELLIVREDRELTVTATLGHWFHDGETERIDFQNSLGGPLSERRAGFPLVLQHDTVLRPTDCGGPLVDLDGKAVGINIARAGRVASYALPASVVIPLLAELKSGKLAASSSPQRRQTHALAESR